MKNRKAFGLLLTANAISQFAQGISMIAIPWFFVNQMEMSSFYNWVFFITTAVTFIWSPVAGTIIDRYPRKRIFQGLCLVGALILFSVSSIGFMEGSLPLALVVAVFAFTVLNYNIHYPSLYALSQEMSEGKVYGKINSFLEVQGQATSMLSGAGAAILLSGLNTDFTLFGHSFEIHLAAWELHEIFLMDGITYALAFLLLSILKYEVIKPKKVDTSKFINRLKNGWKYLADHPLLFRYGLFSYFVFVTVIVHVFYLMHVYVSEYLNGVGYTLAISEVFHTLGALSAGIIARILFKRMHTVYATLLLMASIIVVFVLAGFTKMEMLYWLACLVIGFANSGVRILRVTFLFNHVPNENIGRVTSVFQSSNILLRLFLIGMFNQLFFTDHPQFSYLFNAGFVVLATLPILFGMKKIAKQYPD